MIYFLYGEDKDKARIKAHEMIEGLLRKKPDASFFKIDSENWNEARLEEYIGGQGLFSNRYIVFIDSILDITLLKDVFLGKIQQIADSENIFILLEGKIEEKSAENIKKHAEKTQTFEERIVDVKDQSFNIFSLSDYLGIKDKKNLWVKFVKAKWAGIEDDQIHGTLFWAIKNIIISKGSQSAKEAGLSPFIFGKSKRYSNNFTLPELRKCQSDLVVIFHQARSGKADLGVALEKFILNIF